MCRMLGKHAEVSIGACHILSVVRHCSVTIEGGCVLDPTVHDEVRQAVGAT